MDADVASTNEISVGAVVGLFNVAVGDYAVYQDRERGINLIWLRNEGRSTSSWYDGLVNSIGGAVTWVVNVTKEILNRVMGAADFVLTFYGIMIPKKIRLSVAILRDTDGRALIGDETLSESARAAELQRIDAALAIASDAFREQLNVRIIAGGARMVRTLDMPAPAAAPFVHCNAQGFMEDLYRTAGRYFRTHLTTNVIGTLTGAGAPITVFIVRDIEEKHGCSVGIVGDYVTVDLSGLEPRSTRIDPRPRTLAHEVGHACGLLHPALNYTANLMDPGGSGLNLELHQRAFFRSSRHVTFF